MSKKKSWVFRLYQNILAYCDSKWAPILLGLLSFTESCVFIIPPEVLLLPMCYANKKRSLWYALNTTVTSVLGAVMGYILGAFLWTEISDFVFNYLPGFKQYFDTVGGLFEKNAFSAIFLAAFTVIPFKVFTVTAGVYSTQVSLPVLIGASLVGRGLRYFALASLVMMLGDKAKRIIEEKFTMISTVIGILVVLLIVIVKFIRH